MNSQILFNLLGRNLAALQKIEYFAKAITEMILFSFDKASPGDAPKIQRLNNENNSLGQSIPDYLKVFDSNLVGNDSEGLSIRIKTTISPPARGLDQWKKDLNKVLSERNWLVHKSTLSVDFENNASFDQLVKRLNSQHEFALQILNEIEEQYNLIAAERKGVGKNLRALLSATFALADRKKLKQDADGWILFQRFESRYNAIHAKLANPIFGDEILPAMEYLKSANCEISTKEYCGGNFIFFRFEAN